jgi:hypothetical protein
MAATSSRATLLRRGEQTSGASPVRKGAAQTKAQYDPAARCQRSSALARTGFGWNTAAVSGAIARGWWIDREAGLLGPENLVQPGPIGRREMFEHAEPLPLQDRVESPTATNQPDKLLP